MGRLFLVRGVRLREENGDTQAKPFFLNKSHDQIVETLSVNDAPDGIALSQQASRICINIKVSG